MPHRDFFKNAREITIFDTEWTTWEGAQDRDWTGPNEHRELVQLAAQKIDLEQRKVVDSFESLVRPRINSELSEYFVNLTHITQQQVDSEGGDFADVYKKFIDWAADSDVYSYSIDRGNTDGHVLLENILLYGLDLEYPAERFKTVAPLFASTGVPIAQYSSGQLHQFFDIELSGHVHNAMHDVDSIVASLFKILEQES